MEVSKRRTKTRNQYRRKLWEQKLMGISMLIISAIFLWMCWTANEDCGAFLIIAPLGFILLFSREIWIV